MLTGETITLSIRRRGRLVAFIFEMNDSHIISAEKSSTPEIAPGLVESLTGAYASLLKSQRTASSAYVRWSTAHSRSHEFSWLDVGREELTMGGGKMVVSSESPIYSSVQKMMATMELNPYERELQYGFPYVVGKTAGVVYRAPVFTIPVTVSASGGKLTVAIEDDTVRFNSLPFRSEHDPGAREQAMARLIEKCPNLPLTKEALGIFCQEMVRELGIVCSAKLDGQLTSPPPAPTRQSPLTILDLGALFIAPKTSYFLVSDLETIGESGQGHISESALGWLMGKRPPEPTSDDFSRHRKVFYPFPSNPSQRRVAHLVDNPTSRITVVQGPPGTGKSLTIANLVCHLVALGKKVLVSSQKDKALQVVDELLRSLEMQQLPMTLLRRDRESKKQLSERLESIQKERSSEETAKAVTDQTKHHQEIQAKHDAGEDALRLALEAEHAVERADKALADASGFVSRAMASWKLKRTLRRSSKQAQMRSDQIGELQSHTRKRLREAANGLLQEAADHRVGTANRAERQQLREFARLLGRNQTNYRNYRIFDRLKSDPERCEMLLKILPCWIMSPDDVARLFPCKPGLFDVVIVDEASQCDLPSMTPVLYRAKQAVVAGDSKQMQAQRFAFTSGQVSAQAWAQYGLDTLDPDRLLDPATVDLLQLASLRMDEEAFLNEHYRSLPDIIGFSNQRWYGDRLRIMRDLQDRRVGDPLTPTVSLHRVDGTVSPGTQENEIEARALLDHLKTLLDHPAYSEATFGVVCLFEQQMRLMNDLVAESIDEEQRQAHKLVVVNPDGFQGDERDVILYSLSYDAKGMTREQLSARQADRSHIQGMLNVAFTRPRDEVHIFHSADIADFGMVSGQGAIKDWLEYCSRCMTVSRQDAPTLETQLAKADSGFEQQVMTALAQKNIIVFSQYPCCGYSIDVVASWEERRIAIECDGEWFHLDEHGHLKIEDLERQEVLERAGWTVLRIPYRSWREDSATQIRRVLEALHVADGSEPESEVNSDTPGHGALSEQAHPSSASSTISVNNVELAIVEALRAGAIEKEQVFRDARARLGFSRMGSNVRASLDQAVHSLIRKQIIQIEDGDLFFRNQEMRYAAYEVPRRYYSHGRSRYGYSR